MFAYWRCHCYTKINSFVMLTWTPDITRSFKEGAIWHGNFSWCGFLFCAFLGNGFVSFKPFGVIYFIIWRSLCLVVILQLFSRGSKGEFDGSYQETFSGFNHDPFSEFHKQNDGHFSSNFFKIFAEVIFYLFKYISFHFSFHFRLWSTAYSIWFQVFQQDKNMRANDIKVHS